MEMTNILNNITYFVYCELRFLFLTRFSFIIALYIINTSIELILTYKVVTYVTKSISRGQMFIMLVD